MMRKVFTIGLGIVVCLMAIQVNATTQEDIGVSIMKGIAWLVEQQNPDGSWGHGEKVGSTAFAVVKLEDRAFELGMSPFDEEYEYFQEVISGQNYLFSQAATYGEGTGICFGLGHHVSYNTGIVMMAIAAGRNPDLIVDVPGSLVDDWTHKEVVQANVDFFTWFQNHDGGWQYEPFDPEGFSDNSITGYVVLGLAYAQAPIYGFNCTISDFVKDNLNSWIDKIQIDGGNHDGGSGYGGEHTSNVLRAGNLIFEMAFVGDTPDSQRMQRALDYLGRAWNDPDWSWEDGHGYPGWYGNPDWQGEPDIWPKPEWWQAWPDRYQGWQGPHYQAMYCIMKGLTYAGIDTINADGIEVDWYDAFAPLILYGQNNDGSWDRDYWAGGHTLATEWALLTLEAIAPPGPVINVLIDIKPGSYPNSINPKSKGVISAAILTTDEFDASAVDGTTVRFGPDEAAHVHYALEDVDWDGDLDMILHFKIQDTGSECGDTEATLIGKTIDGQQIKGTDTIRTVGCKEKK